MKPVLALVLAGLFLSSCGGGGGGSSSTPSSLTPPPTVQALPTAGMRVEDTDPVQPRADGGESVHARPAIDLSEEVFAEAPVTEAPEEIDEPAEPVAAVEEPEAPTAEADATGAGLEQPDEPAAATDEE